MESSTDILWLHGPLFFFVSFVFVFVFFFVFVQHSEKKKLSPLCPLGPWAWWSAPGPPSRPPGHSAAAAARRGAPRSRRRVSCRDTECPPEKTAQIDKDTQRDFFKKNHLPQNLKPGRNQSKIRGKMGKSWKSHQKHFDMAIRHTPYLWGYTSLQLCHGRFGRDVFLAEQNAFLDICCVLRAPRTLMWPPLGSRHLTKTQFSKAVLVHENPRSQAPNQRISTERHPNESRDHQDNHLEPCANKKNVRNWENIRENMWPPKNNHVSAWRVHGILCEYLAIWYEEFVMCTPSVQVMSCCQAGHLRNFVSLSGRAGDVVFQQGRILPLKPSHIDTYRYISSYRPSCCTVLRCDAVQSLLSSRPHLQALYHCKIEAHQQPVAVQNTFSA